MTDGEPETAVLASLQKTKSIKNQHKLFFIFLFFYSLNLKLYSDSFVNHFDGHFAYLKTLDFFFNEVVTDNESRIGLRCHKVDVLHLHLNVVLDEGCTCSPLEYPQCYPTAVLAALLVGACVGLYS